MQVRRLTNWDCQARAIQIRCFLCRTNGDEGLRTSDRGQTAACQVVAHRAAGVRSGRIELAARLGSAAGPTPDGGVLSMLKGAMQELASVQSGTQSSQPGGPAPVVGGGSEPRGAASRCHSAPRAHRMPTAGVALTA